ncbi:MAG TPA: MBL fold metallo-hydrolase [Acidimicrobiales bacterium]|jgi:cyclase|nr:MBL fold metallo-hydrolase [Acidimicrobiales bacterium]
MSTSKLDSGSLPPPRAEEVSDGIYAYIQPDGSWYINNTGFLIGRRGVISIDSCSTERRTRAYLDTIAGVTDRPVTTLVNTHHHGDHTHGNYQFEGATIVAHEWCRQEMLATGLPVNMGVWTDVEWGALELAPPFLTYRDEVAIWVDDLRCELRQVGAPAHTTNDSLVWIPERSVLFSGDLLFNGCTPFVLMGSVTGAIDVLQEVVKPLEARTIVPGHGPVAGPGLIDDVVAYLQFILTTAEEGVAAGLSPLAAAQAADLGPFAQLLDPERIVGNLHRAYAELKGAEPGSPIDLVAAIGDMITYNGGRPLTCLA